ncbi:MAG: hypothetical protein GQF41_1160 [Candidatus Rifleibacterium amylolyticum]|nr:MAG: hypothetical protein GQF41_1160 [Candidatus Rifleibacterium amylolyticum]
MPKIKLCLDIEIANYNELAKLYASRHNMPEALVAMMPESALKAAVDGKIVEKVKLKLGDFVVGEVKKELTEQGVEASIQHSYE